MNTLQFWPDVVQPVLESRQGIEYCEYVCHIWHLLKVHINLQVLWNHMTNYRWSISVCSVIEREMKRKFLSWLGVYDRFLFSIGCCFLGFFFFSFDILPLPLGKLRSLYLGKAIARSHQIRSDMPVTPAGISDSGEALPLLFITGQPLPQFFMRLPSVDHASTFPLGFSGLQLWWWISFLV